MNFMLPITLKVCLFFLFCAGHQVHGDADSHVSVLWLAEPHRSRAVREVSQSDHDRTRGLQEGGQDRALQAQREGAPVRDERQAGGDR